MRPLDRPISRGPAMHGISAERRDRLVSEVLLGEGCRTSFARATNTTKCFGDREGACIGVLSGDRSREPNGLGANGALAYAAAAYGTDTPSYTATDQLGATARGTIAPTPTAKVGHGRSVAVASVTPGLAGDIEMLTTMAGRVR